MGADTLKRSGVVRQDRADGPWVIHFGTRHCPGCNGRCGVRFRAPSLAVAEALDLFRAPSDHAWVEPGQAGRVAPATPPDLSPGDGVVVAASARGLRRRALWVFGPPLVAVATSTVVAQFGAWNDWTLGAAAGLAIAVTPALARWKYAA